MFKTRFISILALLLMAVSGAWADETPLVTINSTGYTTFTSGSKTFDDKVTVTFSNSVSNDGDHWGWYADGGSLLTVAGTNGYTITSCKFYTFDGTAKTGYTVAGESPSVYLSNYKVYTDANQSVDLGKFGISKIEVYGGVASATYSVTLKESTEDAANWQGKAGEGKYQELPLTGLDAGTAVTVKYNGTKKVKSVKARKKAAALSLTSPSVGQVIGSDGKNYAAASVPSGVTKVAMIAYVSGSNGLAIALADEGSSNWATAKSTCEAKTPAFTNGTWKLPTQDEWNLMFSANGGNAESYNGLNAAINTAGGTTLQSGFYWSSSEYSPGVGAHLVHLDDGDADWSKANEALGRQVRACLAF